MCGRTDERFSGRGDVLVTPSDVRVGAGARDRVCVTGADTGVCTLGGVGLAT